MKPNTSGRDPLVSVIIGAYNEEDRIAKALQSILGQTFNDFEIIIIDDGSTDDTSKIVNEFDDHRIRLIHNDKNQGLSFSLNRGIYASNGKYIARADADEVSLPFRFQRQIKILEENEYVQVVGCWYRNIGRKEKPIVDIKFPTDEKYGVNRLIKNGPRIAHGSVMIRKKALINAGGYREEFRFAQDYDLWLRLASKFGTDWLHIIPQILYERKIDPHQIEKRRVQLKYSNAAKDCAKMRIENKSETPILESIPEKMNNVKQKTLSERELVGMMKYLAGRWQLKQNEINSALINSILSIWFAPLKIRPWYLLILTLAPNEIRKKIEASAEGRA